MTKIKEYKELKKSQLREYLMAEIHVKEWRESAQAQSRSLQFDIFWNGLLSGLRKYIKFLCSKEEYLEMKFEDLYNEAKESPTAKPAQIKINLFYKWLIKKEGMKPNTAKQYAYSRIRGFYSHNGIIFPTRFRAPENSGESHTTTTDRNLRIIINDEEGLPIIDQEIFQTFFKRLRFRDQVICACQMSGGGNDLSDLLKLTIGQVNSNGNYSLDNMNFFWVGKRSKTGKAFKVFFSSSATKLLKDYVKQERFGAEAEELVFLRRKVDKPENKKTENEKKRLLTPNTVANNYKTALYKSHNIESSSNTYNPLRPKRFRKIFTTITTKRASKLNISPNMIRKWQGHVSNIQDGYVEDDRESILRDYKKIESFFQVFEVVVTDTDKDLAVIKAENIELKSRLDLLETNLERLYEGLPAELALLRVTADQQQLAEDSARANELLQIQREERESLIRERASLNNEEE